MAAKVSLQRLKSALHYDQHTGIFTWRIDASPRAMAGSRAGCSGNRPYEQIAIDGRPYLSHRLAWLYMTGSWPRFQIDHVNGNGKDNRFCNLRDVTPSMNSENRRKAYRTNKTRYLGVRENYGKYEASIGVGGEYIRIGRFPDPESAHAAYIEAKRRLHKGCTI